MYIVATFKAIRSCFILLNSLDHHHWEILRLLLSWSKPKHCNQTALWENRSIRIYEYRQKHNVLTHPSPSKSKQTTILKMESTVAVSSAVVSPIVAVWNALLVLQSTPPPLPNTNLRSPPSLPDSFLLLELLQQLAKATPEGRSNPAPTSCPD